MSPLGLHKLIIASMAVMPAWVSVAAEPSTRPVATTQPAVAAQAVAAAQVVPGPKPAPATQPVAVKPPAPSPATQPVPVAPPVTIKAPTPAPVPTTQAVVVAQPAAPVAKPVVVPQAAPAPKPVPATQPVAVQQPVPAPKPVPAPQTVAVQPPAPIAQPVVVAQPAAGKAAAPAQQPAAAQPPAPAQAAVPEADLLRIENQLLKEQVRGMQRELLSYQSFVTNLGENALRAPFGRMLLVRRTGWAAAIMITEHTRPIEVPVATGRVRTRKGARYSFWVQKDGSADFSKPNVVKGTAEVFEEENGVNTNVFMNLDGLKLPWSMSDWIGFPVEAPDLEMCITEHVRIEDVRFDDPMYVWMSRGKLQDFARSLRRVLAEPASTSPSAS